MRTLQQLLDELKANDAAEVSLDLSFGGSVNASGLSSPRGVPYAAKCGGISMLLDPDEAALLARHGAKTDLPELKKLRQMAPLP